jgi:hypothetical protein
MSHDAYFEIEAWKTGHWGDDDQPREDDSDAREEALLDRAERDDG